MTAHSTTALVALVTLAISQAAWSADKLSVPPQGTATYVTSYISQALGNLEMGDAGSGTMLQLLGVTRRADGQQLFDGLSVRCLLYSETVAGKNKGSGSCSETDSDGDKLFTTFSAGVHTVIGGTGKYKGMSGTASFTVTPLPSPGPGIGAVSVEHKISWQMR